MNALPPVNERRRGLFYIDFPIRDALRLELSWMHYRLLMSVEEGYAREFYMEEAIAGNWSTRSNASLYGFSNL